MYYFKPGPTLRSLELQQAFNLKRNSQCQNNYSEGAIYNEKKKNFLSKSILKYGEGNIA